MAKNIKSHGVSKLKNKVVYDVYYTSNKNGFRKTASSNENSDRCVLFFGDSFMFGCGLNDNETLPYYFGQKSNHKYKIYNFAMPGYAPNQMLSAIENGVVDRVTSKCKETIVVFDTIPDHLVRIAGRTCYGNNIPKYSLVNNNAIYQGHFNYDNKIFVKIVKKYLNKSQTYIFIHRLIIQNRESLDPAARSYYTKLYIAILKKSYKILNEKYNAKRFIILSWDYLGKDILTEFDNNYFEHYNATEIIPGFEKNKDKYIIKNDGHSTKYANEILADFLAKQISSDSNYNFQSTISFGH